MDAYEQAVADSMTRNGLSVFIPHKDKGVDIVVLQSLRDAGAKRIQIQGSRTYSESGRFQAWYKFSRDKLRNSAHITDVWVFVCSVAGPRGRFRPQFVVVPTRTLVDRIEEYSIAAKSEINFYLTEFNLSGRRTLIDDRGLSRKQIEQGRLKVADARNYTEFWSEHDTDIWRFVATA